MNEDGSIAMNEFRMVVEDFKAWQQRIIEIMNHHFEKVCRRLDVLIERVGKLVDESDETKGQPGTR